MSCTCEASFITECWTSSVSQEHYVTAVLRILQPAVLREIRQQSFDVGHAGSRPALAGKSYQLFWACPFDCRP